MELVPIITQILGIVAAVFIIVLIVSFIASKLRKKDHEVIKQTDNYKNQQSFNAGINTRVDKSQYYGGTYYNNNLSYAKEIKVVKRSGISKNQSPKKYTQEHAYSNARFTVLNNISTNVNPAIETDEYGFKVYSNKEITRSVYLQN